MNLELMISEFESEDVIVTSCGLEHYSLEFTSTYHDDKKNAHYDVSVNGFETYNKVVIGTDTYNIKNDGKIDGKFESSLGTDYNGFYHVDKDGKLVYCKDKN